MKEGVYDRFNCDYRADSLNDRDLKELEEELKRKQAKRLSKQKREERKRARVNEQ